MTTELFPVKIIGHIRTDFTSKFGVPRQSGIVDALEARIAEQLQGKADDLKAADEMVEWLLA